MKTKIFPLLLIICLLSFLLTGCERKETPLTKTGFYFDTVISITLYDTSKAYALEHCFELASFYENLLSRTVEGSDVWNINQAEGAGVAVHEETAFLIEKACFYAALTDGLIDPSIAPLSALWNFSSEHPAPRTPPSEAEISSLLPHIDYRSIQLDGQTVTLLDPSASIDLGFIAKGYIADRLKEYLISENIEHALINLGGNVLAIGSKPDGSAYTIGIQKPFAEAGTAVTAVSVTGRSVVSSGIYERYFEKDGTLYHHILNPVTGYPVENELAAVTILSDSSLDGDALSTACLLLGTKKGMALISTMPDTEALFIDKDGNLTYTSGFPARTSS